MRVLCAIGVILIQKVGYAPRNDARALSPLTAAERRLDSFFKYLYA